MIKPTDVRQNDKKQDEIKKVHIIEIKQISILRNNHLQVRVYLNRNKKTNKIKNENENDSDSTINHLQINQKLNQNQSRK